MCRKLHGIDLCRDTEYSINDSSIHLYVCHCKDYEKFVSSEFIPSFFNDDEPLQMLCGNENVTIYKCQDIDFTKAFYRTWVAALPFQASGRTYFVPAGSLTDDPIRVEGSNIVWQNNSAWNARVDQSAFQTH